MDISRREFAIASGSLLTGVGGGYAINEVHRDEPQQLNSPITLVDRPNVGTESSENQIVYWTDFECPFCQRFSREVQDEVLEKLVYDGDTAFAFKILGGLEETSMPAALAAHCVYNNGVTGKEFVEWESEMMRRFAEKDEDMDGRIQTIRDVSANYDVDIPKLQRCIDEEKYADRIETDLQEANKWQFNGTPHFLVFNRETFGVAITSGSRSYRTFEDLVRQVESE